MEKQPSPSLLRWTERLMPLMIMLAAWGLTLLTAWLFDEKDLPKAFGPFIFGGGLCVWVLQQGIQFAFEQRKMNYQQALNHALEQHKHQLNRDMHRFSRLHDKRAEKMLFIYKYLVLLQREMETAMSLYKGDRSDKKSIADWTDQPDSLFRYFKRAFDTYDTNKILFPKQIQEPLHRFMNNNFQVIMADYRANFSSEPEAQSQLIPVMARLIAENKKLLTVLEQGFQELLGEE